MVEFVQNEKIGSISLPSIARRAKKAEINEDMESGEWELDSLAVINGGAMDAQWMGPRY